MCDFVEQKCRKKEKKQRTVIQRTIESLFYVNDRSLSVPGEMGANQIRAECLCLK